MVLTQSGAISPAGTLSHERLPFIDGLRAIAALGVIVCHTEMVDPVHGQHVLLDLGHGVDLFFVLSGFCLAYPTLRKRASLGTASLNLGRFALHRIVRILPPYYFATLLLLGVGAISWLRGGVFAPPGTAPLTPMDVVGQFFMLDRGVALASPPYWTLLVETRWYVLFPALLALWMRWPRVFIVALIAIDIAYVGTRARSLDLGTLPAFMLGIVAAEVLVRQYWLSERTIPFALGVIALAAAVALEPVITAPDLRGIEHYDLIYQSNPGWHLVAFFVVIAAGRAARLRKALSWSPLVFLGVASYSIYLMHYPIVIALGHAMRHGRLTFVGIVIAAVAGGVAFYYLAEQWFCGGPVRAWCYARLEPRLQLIGAWLCGAKPGDAAVVAGALPPDAPSVPSAAEVRVPNAL
jgi:peptidoglycan/LPS O-acetylase OafA/YrhL